MEIKETIIVEGKNDAVRLKGMMDVNIITTDGTHLSKDKISLIKEAQQKCGVIIFTDPDYPGYMIRERINTSIPGCKNAFITSDKARYKGKVGIEHATKEEITNALANLVTYHVSESKISYENLRSLGLIGNKESNKLRLCVSKHLNLGYCNGKTLLKRLNMLDINYEKLALILQGVIDE